MPVKAVREKLIKSGVDSKESLPPLYVQSQYSSQSGRSIRLGSTLSDFHHLMCGQSYERFLFYQSGITAHVSTYSNTAQTVVLEFCLRTYP